ncbi:MAG: aspartate kinase [Nitrosopumilus sp. B06]|nr:MAG: aspartate kinase [Nitrosopumilus sp. D6]RNJ79674.1 MAG: aspartate kinase [Nitrosopumilus sp. B06]
MNTVNLTVAKFGGSAIGADGASIPGIIARINDIKKNSKVIAVVSAPLTIHDGKRRSLTDIILEQGANAEAKKQVSLDAARTAYGRIIQMTDTANRQECQSVIDSHLGQVQAALDEARESGFADEVRSRTLAFSGEILMSRVMNHILRSNKIRSEAVLFEDWPIITDRNIESTNFLASESRERMGPISKMVESNEVVVIGGFIGKTADNIVTTYERGGSDRTAADLGILFHRDYQTSIDFEKDSAVVSADPKIVKSNLRKVTQLSYNEARLAGMFGMKILDPIAIKEIVENGVDMPITITNMGNPENVTVIKRSADDAGGHPIKMVTGKENCAIFRIETGLVQTMLTSLERDRRYGEFVVLSPFTRDGIEFSRILFLDGDYVRRNEKYLLGFDPLATITYERGVITLIGDGMWRVQQVASRTSARIGESGLNILNMDAQEETSRIIIVVEDSGDSIKKAVMAVHDEIATIKFVK